MSLDSCTILSRQSSPSPVPSSPVSGSSGRTRVNLATLPNFKLTQDSTHIDKQLGTNSLPRSLTPSILAGVVFPSPKSPSQSMDEEQTSHFYRKYQPYPQRTALPPLELRFASRSSTRATDASYEDVVRGKEILMRGLAHMSDSTFRKAALAKQATRENMRHKVLQTAWEIEEAERYTDLLKDIQKENCTNLFASEREFHFYRSLLYNRGLPELQDDTHYYQAVYTEELSAFAAAEEQLNQYEYHAQMRASDPAFAPLSGSLFDVLPADNEDSPSSSEDEQGADGIKEVATGESA
ncbi:hypothetical protein BJ138DRAFT_1115197 [Hygrophoropsis aurantiaca]|uniref:Uncharacterized protein n=1 Tax=Hygrophoropsis aurantiaca TaxID=72124 RepID=A0ACB8A8Y5_9AGAM|nr:hypothetical protein BJ138DRAFT_1115197 [Hygrophoropsis aurantiaca]